MSAWRPGACGCLTAMGFTALFAIGGLASSSLAQNTPRQFNSKPASPFQEKGPEDKSFEGVITPQRITREIEAWAKKEDAPLERTSNYFIFDPESAAEFTALGRYSLLVLSVVTQDASELPLKRVYLRTADKQIPLIKISSWRVSVGQDLLTARIYGQYREDGFYLFPTAAFLRTAQLQVDFAAKRSAFPVLELPSDIVPRWLRTLQNPDPEPQVLPNARALQAFIRRNTAGFPPPDPLPAAALPKPPTEPRPQAGEPLKPGSLRDLFKK